MDLHGNAKKKETAPDGGKDVNVFDIQQGVGISLLIKNPALKKGVFHSDLFGKQQYKYNFCEAESIKSIKWRALKPESPFYLFIPQDKTVAKKYQKYTSINDIFNISGVGITTAHDDFVIDFQEGDLLNVLYNLQIQSVMPKPFTHILALSIKWVGIFYEDTMLYKKPKI